MKNKDSDNYSKNLQESDDPIWDLLGKASKSERSKNFEPSDFFTRNVLREARNTPQERSKLFSLSGIKSFLSPATGYRSIHRKLVVGALAACACAMITIQVWDNPTSNSHAVVTNEIEHTTSMIKSDHTALSSFIVEETLIAAAEDTSIFSHDEILAMINL